MIEPEDIRKYLPKYLSSSAQDSLFEELKKFPDNIDQRLYTNYLQDDPHIFQGDGVSDLLFVHLPSQEIKPAPGMVLSNTCDIDPANRRFMPMRMVYAPIINLEKYRQALYIDHVQTGKKSDESIKSHIQEIKKQHISHIFYLPQGEALDNDSIVFFDRLNNCSVDFFQNKPIQHTRLFTLSDYGYYLSLFKLSVHFTRIREGLARSSGTDNQMVMEDYGIYGYYANNL